MTRDKKRVAGSLAFGLCGALALSLTGPVLSLIVGTERTIWISLGFLTAGYALMLAWWSQTPLPKVLFPLFLLAGAVLAGERLSAFLVLALGTLAWIRSGICFPGRPFQNLAIETVLGIGGLALVWLFAPQGWLSLGLGVWLFFLIQSIYFILAQDQDPTPNRLPEDPFEKARRNAETALSACGE